MTTTPPRLHWEVLIRQRPSATQGIPPGQEDLAWVSNAATLIWGEREAVLVDTFLGETQTHDLADWIEAKGRALRFIFLTHAPRIISLAWRPCSGAFRGVRHRATRGRPGHAKGHHPRFPGAVTDTAHDCGSSTWAIQTPMTALRHTLLPWNSSWLETPYSMRPTRS